MGGDVILQGRGLLPEWKHSYNGAGGPGEFLAEWNSLLTRSKNRNRQIPLDLAQLGLCSNAEAHSLHTSSAW